MEQGKISVLMGVYNCADTLAEALDSILAQTYDSWELIVCDDASTDDTYAVAQTYAQRYPDKIILLRNEEHRYLAYALNRCLACASGELVARMDGDDRSHPERFARQVAFLREHEEIVLVGTAMQSFDEQGTFGDPHTAEALPDRNTPYRRLPVFNHATVMAYKQVFDALGGYTVLPRTQRGQDLDLWFRFLKAGYKGANMPQVLYEVREPLAAFKRRTARTRWMVCRTQLVGYRLLGYPWWRYAKPLTGLLKIFVPSAVIRWRHKQRKR